MSKADDLTAERAAQQYTMNDLFEEGNMHASTGIVEAADALDRLTSEATK